MTEDNRIGQIRQRVALHLSERNEAWTKLVRVRAVLDDVIPSETVDRIRAVLDNAPPAPRVFFRGDSVPAGTYLLNCGGGVIMPPDEPWKVIGGTYVELPVMTPEEWQAAVDRATSARAIPEPTEGTQS
jgi:hypothetical protein